MKPSLVPFASYGLLLGSFVCFGLSCAPPKPPPPLPTIRGIKLPNTIHHRFLVYDVKAGAWIDGYNNNPADPNDPWAEPTPIPK